MSSTLSILDNILHDRYAFSFLRTIKSNSFVQSHDFVPFSNYHCSIIKSSNPQTSYSIILSLILIISSNNIFTFDDNVINSHPPSFGFPFFFSKEKFLFLCKFCEKKRRKARKNVKKFLSPFDQSVEFGDVDIDVYVHSRRYQVEINGEIWGGRRHEK